MQTYDELEEHLRRVSARDEGAAAGTRTGEDTEGGLHSRAMREIG